MTLSDIAKQEFIKIADLAKTPDFYKSITNNPSQARFNAGLDIRVNTFKVTEVHEAYSDTGTFIIPLQQKYKQKPLVSGIKRMNNGDYNILLQTEKCMFVENSVIQFNPDIFSPDGDFIAYVKLKVYSLDNVRVTNNI